MDHLPDGWSYVPHGSPESVQVYAPLIGGPDDGGELWIGSCEELVEHVTRKTLHAVHYYGLRRRGGRWVYVHDGVQARAR
jgi:hypothetical protein